MTRLQVTHSTASPPVTVQLGELAIAAGLCGRSVNLVFRDFPAPVLCELWKYYSRHLEPRQVYHVRTPAEARKLAERADGLALVLVHEPRLHTVASWAIQMPNGAASRPAMLTGSVPEDIEDDPGAAIVLQAAPDESVAIMNWLARGLATPPNWSRVTTSPTVQSDPRVESVFNPSSSANSDDPGLIRERQTAFRLAVGACLLQSLTQGNQPGIDLNVGLQDYGLARQLLCSPVVAPADEVFDPIAVNMVNRANVYLSVKYGPDPVDQNPFYADDYARMHRRGGVPKRELATRREIADLGNIRSRAVRGLVEYLRGQPDGHERFRQMGLRRRTSADQWRKSTTKDLVSRLHLWTPKQVRTHFDRLRKENLITAERENANGPWYYGLPEQLSNVNSHFRSLPTPEELAGPG